MAPHRPEVTGCAPDEVAAPKKKRQRRCRGPPSHAFSIMEFCDAHRISRSQYYEMKKLGLGPTEVCVLEKIIITAEAAASWRRKLKRRKLKRRKPRPQRLPEELRGDPAP